MLYSVFISADSALNTYTTGATADGRYQLQRMCLQQGDFRNDSRVGEAA